MSQCMKRFQALLGFCCLVTLLPLASANGQMTHEETVVRQTYAKLRYAVGLGTIHNVLSEDPQITRAALDARMGQEGLQFQLANFTSGKLTDIGQRSYAELMTKPDGSDVLSISTGNHTYTEPDGTKTLDVTAQVMGWEPGQEVTGSFDMPAEKAFAMTGIDRTYSRYAAYTVTVLFRGRSRTAKAIFLFGTNPKGEEEVLAIDTVTGNSALSSMVISTVYPAILLKTKLHGTPAVADWLRSHQSFDATCKPGKEEVCCDPTTLECGVASQDVNSFLSKPVSQLAGAPGAAVPPGSLCP